MHDDDKQQVEPMLTTIAAQTEVLGPVERLIADTGYASENNFTACAANNIEPLIAVGREEHHSAWRERHSEPSPLAADATPMQTMAHRLKTKEG